MVSILYILIGRVSNLSSLSQSKSQSYMLTVAKSFNLLTTIKITFFAITFLPYVAFMRSKSFYRFNHDARLFSSLELHVKFLIKLIQKLSIKYTSQFFKNRFVSQIYGFLLVCVLPCCAFTVIEGWSYLDAVYFSLISLTTIGFGDFIPSVAPPAEYAINVRNDSACFQAMVDSTHTFKISNITGLPIKCNPVSQFEILDFSETPDLRNNS